MVSWWSANWRFRFEMKIDPRGAYLRGLRLRRDPAVVIAIFPIYHSRVGISGIHLLSTSRRVNMFEGVGNDLPAALPHASPRLKIQMAPRWCCRVTPPPPCRDQGVGILGALLYSRGLRFGPDPVAGIGIVVPLTPHPPLWIGLPGRLLSSRSLLWGGGG